MTTKCVWIAIYIVDGPDGVQTNTLEYHYTDVGM